MGDAGMTADTGPHDYPAADCKLFMQDMFGAIRADVSSIKTHIHIQWAVLSALIVVLASTAAVIYRTAIETRMADTPQPIAGVLAEVHHGALPGRTQHD